MIWLALGEPNQTIERKKITMKKWKSGKNRHELHLLGESVCVLHYDPEFGYYCAAQIGNGIRSKSFGFCSEADAKRLTEAWYATHMKSCYEMHLQCAEKCLEELKELEAGA